MTYGGVTRRMRADDEMIRRWFEEEAANMDYPYIRAWGRELGSSGAYVQEQVERARRDKAPQDAIYYMTSADNSTFDSSAPTHHWERFGDIRYSDVRDRVERYAEEFRGARRAQ